MVVVADQEGEPEVSSDLGTGPKGESQEKGQGNEIGIKIENEEDLEKVR